MNRYRFKFLGVVVLIGVSMSVLVRCSYRAPTDEPLDDGRYDSISIIPSINESQEHVVLNRSEASDDLAQLADIICTRHSYTSSTEFDYVAAIDHLQRPTITPLYDIPLASAQGVYPLTRVVHAINSHLR